MNEVDYLAYAKGDRLFGIVNSLEGFSTAGIRLCGSVAFIRCLQFFRGVETMNVTLTRQQEKYVRSQLQGGNYDSVQQLISEAQQLLE